MKIRYNVKNGAVIKMTQNRLKISLEEGRGSANFALPKLKKFKYPLSLLLEVSKESSIFNHEHTKHTRYALFFFFK